MLAYITHLSPYYSSWNSPLQCTFLRAAHKCWEICPKASRHRCSLEKEALEMVTFDRQRITRSKNCKVAGGRTKAKQRSGRKHSWQLWHTGPIFLLDAHVVLSPVSRTSCVHIGKTSHRAAKQPALQIWRQNRNVLVTFEATNLFAKALGLFKGGVGKGKCL